MKNQKMLGFFALFLLLQTVLWACTSLRTELFREETSHLYNNACRHYKQGDYEAARAGFEKVINYDPDYGPAHAALGNLALIADDYSLALAHYQKAVAVDPELEADLLPLIMVAGAHETREPLQKAGIGLDRVHPLIMADRQADVETLLEKDIPLQLLANDTMSITPGKLGELQRKVAEIADPDNGSARYRLFLGYLLFFGQTDDALATVIIDGAVGQVGDKDRQEAFVVLGQLYERRGDHNNAVDAYLAAVDAGMLLTDVAHHLARVYKVDIAGVLPAKPEPEEERARLQPMRIGIRTHLPAQPAPDLGPLTEMKDIQTDAPRGSGNAF